MTLQQRRRYQRYVQQAHPEYHQKYKKKIFFNSGYEDLDERNAGKDRLCFKRNDMLIATLERFDRL